MASTAEGSQLTLFNVQANRRLVKDLSEQLEQEKQYIADLERLLTENGIEVPEGLKKRKEAIQVPGKVRRETTDGVMPDGSLNALKESIARIQQHLQRHETHVQFRDLTAWNMVAKEEIETVGLSIKRLFWGAPKHRVDILHKLTGRIAPHKLTLVLGPPGCGKSTLLKTLSGQSVLKTDGEILYNGDSIDSGKYLVGKVASYVDEKDQHAGTLTVRETMEFSWQMTSGGHHSYGVASNESSAAILDKDDKAMVKVRNVIKVLGLNDCANTVVGDGMLRGVSGGQKRRVTVGEMILPPRPVKFMDAISNGLDAATTYDLTKAMQFITQSVGMTAVVSLLQPSPDVFYCFDELILMSEGQIIYHGPVPKVLEYFERLGYVCPEIMDVPDFLQEVPTPDGRRFLRSEEAICQKRTGGSSPRTLSPVREESETGDKKRVYSASNPPIGTTALVKAWKESSMYEAMLGEMDELRKASSGLWAPVFKERFAGKPWFTFKHLLDRQFKLTIRDTAFLKGRIMQNVIIGGISGSLYNNLAVDDSDTMSGVLFFAAMYGALSAMSMLPTIFAQRAVFYKHSKSLFYPTPSFVLVQTVVLYPLQALETILFTTIVYWSVGLSAEENGSRYFTFMFVVFVFNLCVSQMFRLIASCVSSSVVAQPLAGTFIVLMVLFSGYIVPKSNIPPGWEWFYWINPIAYVLKAVTVNEFLASDYDFTVCLNVGCTVTERYGNLVLEARGNPTEQVWVWYSVAVLVALYLLFLVMNAIALIYLRNEPTPPPPCYVPDDEDAVEDPEEKRQARERKYTAPVEIDFDPVTFAFKDIFYSIRLKNGEELDLLKGVSGFFEPRTVTALMGSSGAGKTTLLDVLAGRKNTGHITGEMHVNGKPKDERSFRRIMGYVEQFDTLSPHDTAREAVEFSAALRLPRETPAELRNSWVNSVLTMLELMPLANTMVGSEESGGMSFEQKKRVSIATELAANPAILFLDEPTTGLDSRAAQVVMRCVKRVAASGRSIVCTIHQPSAVIFEAFDNLLLLRRGGQTVFFGELGEHCSSLISYMESMPGVQPKPESSNPATWMLEVIGAGTGGGKGSSTAAMLDHHAFYLSSSLCTSNVKRVNVLCGMTADGLEIAADDVVLTTEEGNEEHATTLPNVFRKDKLFDRGQDVNDVGPQYNATYWTQFRLLMYRFLLAYWRSPSYNFVRMLVSVVIALIFSSTYANQDYSTDVDVISRVALIYITVLFMGVVGMMSVQPVMFSERPAFYREKFSELYDVKLYTLAGTLVEIPYLVISSVFFLIPYFFIVGFQHQGDVAAKFFWYWLFQALYMSVLVFLGHLLAAVTPDTATANVIGGMSSTMISLFCGFMIKPQDYPQFWTFMYWLDPLHYAIEGIETTQFSGDHTPVTTTTGVPVTVTAETFVNNFYEDWSYRHRGMDVLALCLFIVVFRLGTYFGLEYMRHDKR